MLRILTHKLFADIFPDACNVHFRFEHVFDMKSLFWGNAKDIYMFLFGSKKRL